MLKFILKRVLQAIPVLLGLSIVVFLIMHVFSPDPAPVVLGEHATAEQMNAWRDANGLNQPLLKQYFDFLFGALHGDLGTRSSAWRLAWSPPCTRAPSSTASA